MYRCELLQTCTFFDDGGGYSPELNHMMKEHYCADRCEDCARYRAIHCLGRDNVPSFMLPTEHDRVEQLLAN